MILGFDDCHSCKIYLPSTQKHVEPNGRSMSEAEIIKIFNPVFPDDVTGVPTNNKSYNIFKGHVKTQWFCYIYLGTFKTE